MTEYVIFEEADGSLTVNLNGGEIVIRGNNEGIQNQSNGTEQSTVISD